MEKNEALEYLEEIPHIDRQTINALFLHSNGDKSVLSDIFCEFYSDAGHLVSEITLSGLSAKDFELQQASHSLSGISSSVGALRLKEICRMIDNFIKTGNKSAAFDLSGYVNGYYEEFVIQIKSII
jgi:HPt (histidine-containing phosphotransfer) domain-containing protein